MRFSGNFSASTIHALPRGERKGGEKWRWRAEKTNIHMYKVMYTIFKHISKSSDFEIISQNKFSILSHPLGLYLDCTIYVYEQPWGTESNKNKYFYPLCHLSKLYLCTLIAISLAYCEWRFKWTGISAQCVFFFHLFLLNLIPMASDGVPEIDPATSTMGSTKYFSCSLFDKSYNL